MRTNRTLWVAVGATATIALGSLVVTPAEAAAPTMIHTGTATRISEYPVPLTVGTRVTIETADLSTGSDTVLHLLSPSGTQVAVNDNVGASPRSRVSYTPPSNGTYRVVVRARTNSTAGTATLRRNGSVWRTGVQFGGWSLSLASLRARESLETVRLPGGAGPNHSLYVLKSDDLGIAVRRVGGGTGGAAAYQPGSALGTRTVVVGVPRGHTSGAVRLLRNDAGISGHDSDGDRLGNELESQLGTCSNRTQIVRGFECSRAADARDTDGDGIRDLWEVLGRRDGTPHQPLPLWGSDPRHKDLFVEVDFMKRRAAEPSMKMPPQEVRDFAAYYQDQVGNPSALKQALHAAVLRNPDGRTGIAVHLDTGVVPGTRAEATLYGNWGGYSVVPPVSEGQGADFTTAWKTWMSPMRRGIFRYALPYSSGGGSVPINSFAFAWGLGSGWLGAHESGHAMGLGHSGPDNITPNVDVNCKPNYPSLMNYAYQSVPNQVGFADGTGTYGLNNAAVKEYAAVPPSNTAYLDVLENVFRYYVDRTNGHVDWNRDGVIAPDGATVRAYVNYKPGGGGCEYTRYNPYNFKDASARRSPTLVRLGNRLYAFYSEDGVVKYRYSTGSWNCSAPGPTCGTNSFGSERSTGVPVSLGFDAERIREVSTGRDRILLVATDGYGVIRERRLSVNVLGTESWSATATIDASPSEGQPSLARIDNGASVYLAYLALDNQVRTKRLWTGGGWEAETVARTPSGGTIAVNSDASPAIAQVYTPYQTTKGLYGVFADAESRLQLYWHNPATGFWEKTDVLESHPKITGRPSMAWVPRSTAAETPGRLYLAYADDQRVARWMMSYVKVTKNSDGSVTKAPKIGLAGPFDNVWAKVWGIDLYYESGKDTNLRALLSWAIPKWDRDLQFRPKADGIQDFRYVNYDDWKVLRVNLCRNVVNPGGTVSGPPTCPNRDW